MVENIADKFEKTMKKGFINIFVLLVLNKEPTHGYHIKKLIKQRTLGVWAPTDSTMYTVLKDLRDKELIKQQKTHDPDDSKKVYELTVKGKEILDLMLQKEREIRESMRSIIFSTSEVGDEFLKQDLQDLILKGPTFQKILMQGFPMRGPFKGSFKGDFMSRIEDKPKKEQLEILDIQKLFISKQIEYLSQRLTDVDKKISDLRSET
ncbi:MAG: PadR family transcriptional regulator [Promethearchaeota archaeon]|jgi:DNA-binding PadR family transcriptional regulator